MYIKNAKLLRLVLSIIIVMILMSTSVIGTIPVSAVESDVSITNLEVEDMINPIGIDVENPRFSWIMKSSVRGQKQTAYQILVSSGQNGNGDVWDSGMVESDKSLGIEYDGPDLQASTRYYWNVTVWDKDGNTTTSEEAYFETGLMSTDGVTNWDGAKWISIDKPLSTYEVEAKITLPSVTEEVYSSLVFSGKDPGHYFYWKFSLAEDGNLVFEPRVVFQTQLDTSELYGIDDYPLVESTYDMTMDYEPVKTSVYAGNSTEITVNIQYNASENSIVTKVNDTEVLTLNDPVALRAERGMWGTNPALLDWVNIKEGKVGMQLTSNSSNHPTFSASYDDIKVTKDGVETFADDFSGTNVFDGGHISDGKLVMTLPDGSDELLAFQTNYDGPAASIFRAEKPLDGNVKSARLYISSLGVYDAYLNGEKIGIVNDDGSTTYELLNPGANHYDFDNKYITYDVTSYLKDQDNATLSATVGNGWYNGRISYFNHFYSPKNKNALFAKLLITYEDGSTDTMVTNTSDWKATDRGPVTANSIFDGEVYDATREITGYTTTGFDASGWYGVKEHPYTKTWPNATITAHNGNTVHLLDELDRTAKSITTYTGVTNKESSENGKGEILVDSNRTFTEPDAAQNAKVTISSGDTVIYNMGQNMVGVPRITVKGDAGATVKLRMGEILNDDSAPADGPKGSLYTANLRTAKQTMTYTLKGSPEGEVYQPTLTHFGFQYIEVTVLTPDATVEIENITGKVATSAIDRLGYVETSNADVNKLYNNSVWGQRGNFLSVPTDTPARDEREGWAGDAQLFANTALYHTKANNFLQHFQDLLVISKDAYMDGSFPNTAPHNRDKNVGSGWNDAGIIIPWTVWQMSGDTTIIEKNYKAMTEFMDWIYDRTGTTYRGPGASYGDHLAFQGTNGEIITDAFYAYDAKLMADMARALGNTIDAEKYSTLFENIRAAFIENHVLVSEDGEVTVKSGGGGSAEDNSQTALLWSLKLGMYNNEDQKQQMIDLLLENIENSPEYKAENPNSSRVNHPENSLAVGFLGSNIIAPVLSDIGHSDVAYKLLLQDKLPSWLYPVKNGATTSWERWDSYSLENGFGDNGMNSFNHYAYGSIAEWMYRYMAGINYDTENPGFKHILLQPNLDPNNGITWVNGSYDSPYGKITSNWEVNTNIFTYNATVPANTTATLSLPVGDVTSVTEGGQPISEVEGVTFVEYKDGKAVYELESGSYNFTSNLSAAPEPVENVNELHALVDQYTESGDISSDQFARTFDIHLTSVSLYEANDQTDKLVKHLNSFLVLLDYVKQQGFISDAAYNDLRSSTENLLEN